MNCVARITDAEPTVEVMRTRIARFADLIPTDDYVDAGIPGCERTTLRVIGNPQHAPIAANDFHLNLVKCAPGQAAPLHSHATPETFIALTGEWEVFWGPTGARSVRIGPWDTIVIPPGVSRGFRNVGGQDAWLVGIAGGKDPGAIDWPVAVRQAASQAGVELPSPSVVPTPANSAVRAPAARLPQVHGVVPAQAPVIETERVRLRAFENSDLDDYAPLCADPETMRYLGAGGPLTQLDAYRQIATFAGSWQLIGCGQWALTRRSDGRLIGRIGFLDLPGWPDLEVGWMLDRNVWGQGYAHEAARAVISYGFKVLERDQVISLIRAENVRSIRLAERLGARLDGEIEFFGAPALVYRFECDHWKQSCALNVAGA